MTRNFLCSVVPYKNGEVGLFETVAVMFPKTITLQLDFDKSLKTPKVSSQDWYYSVKLRTHLLGIFCANDGTIYCFQYDETVGSTGPNEVISLLDFLLVQLERKLGKHDHLIVWCDNAPGQFKQSYLFFYLDYIVRRGQFLRADLKFLLEGHTYSVCDRWFGNIQTLYKTKEIVDVPRQWATVLEQAKLSHVAVKWVTVDMIKDFKKYLTGQYISRNVDVNKEKFEVKKIAWLNFGYGEQINEHEELQLIHHPNSVFVRFQMDPKQLPRKVNFLKQKQGTDELRPEDLTVLRQEPRPVKEDVKRSCIKLAQKYLSVEALRYYESLPSRRDDDNDSMVSDETQ